MRYPLIGDFPFSRFCRLLAGFRRDCRGYAVALTLVALPLIVGVAAWVIDASRITNLHTDLQNATDAMALAGARELDGRNDAITRAKAAIAELNKNQAWFGGSGGLGNKIDVVYNSSNAASSTVSINFLDAIPASDSTPIDAAWVTAHAQPDTAAGSNAAKYVQVISKPQDVFTIFPIAFPWP